MIFISPETNAKRVLFLKKMKQISQVSAKLQKYCDFLIKLTGIREKVL